MSSAHDDAPGDGHELASSEHSELAAADASERSAAPPDEPAPTLLANVGQIIADRYTLEGLLGTGSIGRTFRARAHADGSKVALKLVDPKLAAEANFLRRLTRDVEAASKLENKHIAHTIEQGFDAQHGPFIVRELVDGEDLISAAQRAPLTPHHICELLGQLLSALSDAHRHGVLHRNLKPQNVRVAQDREGHPLVKLCDFGNPQRVRVGAEYLAPEQASGGEIDGQADVYAVGAIMYELLTGAPPFRGATPVETITLARSTEPIAPRDKRPDHAVPRELEAVCLKALKKQPSARHRSPREMSQALRAAVVLLAGRADEPIGSPALSGDPVNLAESPTGERLTMPGEQLRSRTKFWLGAGLLAAVCVAVILNPEVEPRPDPLQANGEVSQAARMAGEQALERGIAKLNAGEAADAVPELRNARRALGDVPEVLRALGEALLLHNERAEGALLLHRYLELEPHAEDEKYLRALIDRE